MFTDIIRTASRSLHLALRLRMPFHGLRVQVSYGTMTVCTLLSIISCLIILRVLFVRYEGDYTNFMDIWASVGPVLILMCSKYMYIISGIIAAALSKRFSLMLLIEKDDNKKLFSGIPAITWILCLLYILLETILYYLWSIEIFRHAYIDSPTNGDQILYWSLNIVNLLFDFLPFVAAGHLYLSAIGAKVENKIRRTIILIITGYAVSCILFCIFNLFTTLFIGFLTTLSAPLKAMGVFSIIFIYFFYSFGMPAFVLLTHCAYTELEDTYQLDFEMEKDHSQVRRDP